MQGESFQFAAQPRAAPVKMARPKYRDEREEEAPMNLMQDPRVFRGNTYSAQVMTKSAKSDMIMSKTDKSAMRSKARGKFKGRRGGSPPPVEGRLDNQAEDVIEAPKHPLPQIIPACFIY